MNVSCFILLCSSFPSSRYSTVVLFLRHQCNCGNAPCKINAMILMFAVDQSKFDLKVPEKRSGVIKGKEEEFHALNFVQLKKLDATFVSLFLLFMLLSTCRDVLFPCMGSNNQENLFSFHLLDCFEGGLLFCDQSL